MKPIRAKPIVLAGTGELKPFRLAIGLFWIVWGGVFAGVPLLMMFGLAGAMRDSHGMLLVFVVLGLAAFFGGLYLLLLKKQVRYLPARAEFEQTEGLFGGGQPVLVRRATFDRVHVEVATGVKGMRYHEVNLRGPAIGPLSLGSRYDNRKEALGAGLRAARAAGLPLDQAQGGGRIVRLDRAQIAKLPASDEAQEETWWRRPSAIALVLANLVPLGGVLFLGWDVLPLMLLFWLENLVIGGYTVARMLIARGGPEENSRSAGPAGKVFICVFFILHFGSFTAGHGLFLLTMFARDQSISGTDVDLFSPAGLLMLAGRIVVQNGLLWGLLALIVSHGVSFYSNYLRPRAYEDADARGLMFSPYKRIVILHVVILLGGFAARDAQSHLIALILLLVLKTGVDLVAHLREHRRKAMPSIDGLTWMAAPAAAAAPAPAARDATADLDDQPLVHYLGDWRLAAGETAAENWVGGAEFRAEQGRLRLRLADGTGFEISPQGLDAVNVRGTVDRIEFIEVRLHGDGRQRILRFTASGTHGDRLDLNEIQHPEGNPRAMQARLFSLARRAGSAQTLPAGQADDGVRQRVELVPTADPVSLPNAADAAPGEVSKSNAPGWRSKVYLLLFVGIGGLIVAEASGLGVLDRLGAIFGRDPLGAVTSVRNANARPLAAYVGWWGDAHTPLGPGWVTRIIVRAEGDVAYVNLWSGCPPNHCPEGEFKAKLHGRSAQRVEQLEVSWVKDGLSRRVLLSPNGTDPNWIMIHESRVRGRDVNTSQSSTSGVKRVK